MKTTFINIPQKEELYNRKRDKSREVKSVLPYFLPPVILQNKNMEWFIKELDIMIIKLINSVETLKDWTHITK